MENANETKYIVVLQCHIAKERCSGFHCENAFFNREDSFEGYSPTTQYHFLTMTCGGCCGQATLRKLSDLFKRLRKRTDIQPNQVVLHFASCIAFDSFHGPPCPHYDLLKTLVERKGLSWREGSRISKLAQRRRDEAGVWKRSRAAHPPRKSKG